MFIVYLIIFLFGLCVGSFLNAWIWRLHTEESIIKKRSYCPKCKRQIKNFDLIPVLSFLFLGGKCRSCKGKISWQYPIVELVVASLFLISFKILFNNINVDFNNQVKLVLYWYFITVMIVVFVYDLKYYLILDKVVIPAMITIFAINIYLGMDWKYLVVGALLGGGFFALQFIVSKGKWIGGGDIRLGVLIGLMFGWQGVLLTLFIAYIGGAIVGVGLMAVGKKKMSSKLPFGTFLSIGAIITLLWGERIIEWYLKMIGM